MSTTAAVLVSVEFQASGHASNGVASAIPDGEFSGADGVQVREATSTTTVILATTTSNKGTINGNHGDGKIVTINKGDIVVVNTAPSVESDFGKGYWRDTTSSGTFDPVSAVT